MNPSTDTPRRRSLGRRTCSRPRLLSITAAAVLLAACGERAADAGEGGSSEDVLTFFQAGAEGDVNRQLRVLAAREDANELGARVLAELHPPKDLRYFVPRSVELDGVRNDTAWWSAWGIGPDYSRRDPLDTVPSTGLSDADLLLLPRTRSERRIRLVRGPEGWKLPLSSAHAGPVLMGLDSLDARCPYGRDPRPCRALAERLLGMIEALPPGPRERWDYLAARASHRIQTSRAMDSLQVEVVRVNGNPYRLDTGVEVVVINRSGMALGAVFFRLVDAEGSVLEEHGTVVQLPPRGRKEAYITIQGRNFPRPVRAELTSAYPD